MKFYIEYETPPLRSISYTDFEADTEEQAKEMFFRLHPRSKIRKIEGYHS